MTISETLLLLTLIVQIVALVYNNIKQKEEITAPRPNECGYFFN